VEWDERDLDATRWQSLKKMSTCRVCNRGQFGTVSSRRLVPALAGAVSSTAKEGDEQELPSGERKDKNFMAA